MKKHENFIYITGDTHGDLTRIKKSPKVQKAQKRRFSDCLRGLRVHLGRLKKRKKPLKEPR
jgi:hypothetical protein